MFVDKSIGGSLRRKQLKWLLVAFVAVAIAAVLLILSKSMKEPVPVSAPAQPLSDDMVTSMRPTQEEIDKQLEALATEDVTDPAPKPTQEEIDKQLEALAVEDSKDPAPKPTQEEIERQLEELSRQ